MIFKIVKTQDKLIERAFQEGMKYLNGFWGINWVNGIPNILVCSSREELDGYKGSPSNPQTVAIARGKDICILDFESIGSESSLNLNEKQYSALIKHELCHLFTNVVSGGKKLPMWLSEGLSIYLSGQTKKGIGIWDRPNKFVLFLESSKENPKGAYEEGGYAVEMLVTKFGKEKIIELIRTEGEPDISNVFKNIFGFELTYEEINKIM